MDVTDAAIGAADLSLGGKALQALCPEPIRLPLVSIILRNWNYAEYVGAAIDSIRTQSYPRIETIVVDNASTDRSVEVIERHTAGDPLFRTLQLDSNRGPLGGALAGLDAATGDLVVFLDSDDYLLPDFVSWHVQTHLAVRRNVAFTSSNVLEVSGSGTLVAGGRALLGRDWGPPALCLRPAETIPRLSMLTSSDYEQLAQVAVSLPPSMPGWLWAPGSANMYRRFILDMLRPSPDPETMMRLAADGHFSRLAHSIGGSALILWPLSAYRIHGRNHFATSASLPGLRMAGSIATTHTATRRLEALRVLLRDVPESVARIGTGRFWSVFRELLTGEDATAGRGARDPAIQAMVAEHLPQIVRQFGARPAIRMLREPFGTRRLRKIVAAAHGGSPPLRMRRLLLMEELRRFSRRVLRRRRATKPGVPAQEAKTRPAAPG